MEQTIGRVESLGDIKVVERPYRVDKPVFVPYEVKVPSFVDEQVKVPIGFDKVIEDVAEKLFLRLKSKFADFIDAELSSAISKRIKEIEVPKIIERDEIRILYRDVPIDRPVIKDVPVTNAVITDKPVTNSIIKDVQVINAVITEVNVLNAVITDVPVNNFVLSPGR